MTIDIDECGPIVTTMWRELAESAKEIAHANMIEGNLEGCLKHAQFAEAAYWRATGEGDCMDVKGGLITGWDVK